MPPSGSVRDGVDNMLKSEAERVIRKAMEEHKAQFTDEQVNAMVQFLTKIVSQSIEEAFASWSPKGGGPYR